MNKPHQLLYSLIKFSPIILLFALAPHAQAQELSSPNYTIKGGTINITGGQKTSPPGSPFQIKLNDTVGQTIQGKFESVGYQIAAGFQSVVGGGPFAFSISNSAINFGQITSGSFVTGNTTLTVSVGSADGYSVKAIENHSVKTADGKSIIPDTSCDSALPCAVNKASPWLDINSYGFGYNMNGSGIDQTQFVDQTYFQPFPDNELNEDPVTLMSNTNVRNKKEEAVITLKLNIPSSQANGIYQNAIQFIALPSF